MVRPVRRDHAPPPIVAFGTVATSAVANSQSACELVKPGADRLCEIMQPIPGHIPIHYPSRFRASSALRSRQGISNEGGSDDEQDPKDHP